MTMEIWVELSGMSGVFVRRETAWVSERACAKALMHKSSHCTPGPLELGARQGTGYQEMKKEGRGQTMQDLWGHPRIWMWAGVMQQAYSAVIEMPRLGPGSGGMWISGPYWIISARGLEKFQPAQWVAPWGLEPIWLVFRSWCYS